MPQRSSPREVVVDIDSLIRQAKPDEMIPVVIAYDPNRPGSGSYLGLPLNQQLQNMLRRHHLSADRFDVMFVCKDGYAPVRHAAELLKKYNGYLVFKDESAAPGRNWPESMEQTFSPCYLVWQTDSSASGALPWPYGLIRIKLVERDSLLLSDLSRKDRVLRGYHLFRNYCFSCHSLNKTGGQVGPELNWPRNITEYWTDEHIRQYIKEPQSFRFNAHMPAMKQLNDADIDALIQYLHYMKKYKLHR